MGGLVVKKAFILGHHNKAFETLVNRVRAIFFLAVPHQGADIANTLSRILALVPGSRPFVQDLFPQSPAIQSINDDFPRYMKDLQLFSFFESRPMNYGVGKGLIVEKHSAVMNYANERRTYLDANHRDVARYSSPEEPSYLTVRNALAAVISSLRHKTSHLRDAISQDLRDTLGKFLGISESHDDVIMMQDHVRLQGSGEWLLQKSSFREWRDSLSSKLFWLRGRPGAGKSYLAGNVVNHLREQNYDCCCFFFSSRDNNRSTINSFLRSMAFQMALLHPEILAWITEFSTRADSTIDKIDHNPVWRQIFLSSILKIKLNRQQFWVIDAIDECKNGSELINFLTKAQEMWPLCIFKTSRTSFETFISSTNTRIDIAQEIITDDDSSKDIRLFLDTNLELLPASGREAKQEMARQILQNSRGCFLWANLMLNELRQVHTTAETRKVLQSNPSDMDDLYRKVVRAMAGANYGKDLAKAILTWATCSLRPLSTAELHVAVETDINDTIDDIERSVASCCGNLVYVDSRGRLQLIHSTAREFLLRKGEDSEFAIDKADGNKRLADVCLRYLMKTPPKSRKPPLPKVRRILDDSAFNAYACDFVFQHLVHIKSSDDRMLSLLAKFLSSPTVLNWIEQISRHFDLQKIYQAGNIILNLLNRRAQHTPPIGFQSEISILQRWANDFIYLVTKFSRRLKLSPSSIHHIIPPFCPPNSIIRKQCSIPNRGLSVHGLRETGWDDCLTTITYAKGTRPLSLASGRGFFALGMSTGRINVYDDTIFQEIQVLDHTEPVWILNISETGRYLASTGAKSARVWNTETWTEILKIPLKSLTIALTFTEDDNVLVIASKNNQLVYWDLDTCELRVDPTDWTRDFVEEGPELHIRQPTMAALCSHQNLLAVVYRGEDLLLWDIEQDRIHDIYEKDTGSRANGSSKLADGATTVKALAFSAALDTTLLATTYTDGDLIVYDTLTGNVKSMLPSQCSLVLASSPDGRTLAGGDSRGTVVLYDFESLRFLYKVSFDSTNIMAKSFAFTSNGLSLIDVRAFQCRVWQPAVLLRQDMDDEVSDTVSISTAPQEIDYQALDSVEITAITCSRAATTSLVFCGKEDGSIYVHDISGAAEPYVQQLFVQTHSCSITHLHFEDQSGILICSDASSRVTCRKIIRLPQHRWDVGEPLFDRRFGIPITQALTSGRHTRLLVSTEEKDTLWSWSEEGEHTYIDQVAGSKKARWISNSAQPDTILLCKDCEVELYEWSTLQRQNSTHLADLNGSGMSVVRPINLNHHRFFGTVAMDSTKPKSFPPSIEMWDFNEFNLTSKSSSPSCTLGSLSAVVEIVIGVYFERLIYLDASYWVCSINLGANRELPVRHFFIPNDWISFGNHLMMEVGKNGEILFVKQSELAVIKRGLEVTESGVAFNPRRRSTPLASEVPSRPSLSIVHGRPSKTEP
jgi:WD40 repeat protein